MYDELFSEMPDLPVRVVHGDGVEQAPSQLAAVAKAQVLGLIQGVQPAHEIGSLHILCLLTQPGELLNGGSAVPPVHGILVAGGVGVTALEGVPKQVAQLRELLSTAGTRVRVRLESDDRTEVTVYQVGRMGTFFTLQLELRPGTYTVVGSRSGYRDVRRKLVVAAGEQPEPLVILCEEKI